MRRLLTGLALSGALFTATPALAFDPPSGSPGLYVVAERLELTDEQLGKVSDLLYESDKADVDIRARIDRAELDLRHLLDATELDAKAIRKAVAELNAAEGDARSNRIELALSLREVLTLDQWRELERMRARRKHGGPEGPPRGPGAPEPPPPPEPPRHR